MDNGASVSDDVRSRAATFGDDAITWDVSDLTLGPGMADLTINVNLTEVMIDGESRTFEYQVTIFDPALVVVPENAVGMWRVYE